MTMDFKVAALVTACSPRSHADVIVSCWLQPRPGDEAFGSGRPRKRIASLYVDQQGPDDIGVDLAGRHGVRVFGSVADALTMGAGDLVVEAVLLIGEHGSYL